MTGECDDEGREDGRWGERGRGWVPASARTTDGEGRFADRSYGGLAARLNVTGDHEDRPYGEGRAGFQPPLYGGWLCAGITGGAWMTGGDDEGRPYVGRGGRRPILRGRSVVIVMTYDTFEGRKLTV